MTALAQIVHGWLRAAFHLIVRLSKAPGIRVLTPWILAFVRAIDRFATRGAMASSAQISMSLLLAIFPFVLAVLTIAGMVSAQIDSDAITDLIFGAWPEAVAKPILNEVNEVTAQSTTGQLTFGLVLALFFASNGIGAIRAAITRAYRDEDDRSFWRGRLQALLFVVAGAIILSIVATLQVFIPLYLDYFHAGVTTGLANILTSDAVRHSVTWFVLVGGLLACHIWLPGLRLKFWEVLPGVIFTIVLWWITSQGFSYYVTNLSDYSVTYAGLAGIMAAIIFLNLMAAIFILGAEFNAQLRQTHAL